ncbi:MAG: NADH-quinone oxidoreductase subunit C [bacterium]
MADAPAPAKAPKTPTPADGPVAAPGAAAKKAMPLAAPAPTSSAAPAPAAPPKPAAAAPPPKPAPEPTGDYAMVRDAHAGDVVKFEVLEDGVGVLTVTPDGLFTVASEVKALGYHNLSLLSAYDRGDHFGVLYAFVKLAESPAQFGEMRLRVVMPKKDAAGAVVEPSMPSLCDIWPAANWQEREMYDMYGIKFEGHPDLRRMFLPADWTGYPMRKDYKEPEQFVGMRDGEDITYKTQEEGSW